jgi:hypothetical protein
MLFDFKSQKWLATGLSTNWPNWSHDGKDLYVIGADTGDDLLKVHIADHKATRLFDMKKINITGSLGSALALAPDDSPLLLRDMGTNDVYALDWELR